MSSTDHRGIPPGNAAIIAAIIGAGALLLGAIIGVVFGAKSQTIQVILGGDTPTAGAQSNILGLPLPQPTYTLLPTYTPYPTLKTNAIVVTPKPLVITATPSADQQNPPPGSMIPLGEAYTKNGVTVLLSDIYFLGSDTIGMHINVENNSPQQILTVWKYSYVHLQDDKGNIYHQPDENTLDWKKTQQNTLNSGNTFILNNFIGCCYSSFMAFTGKIDPTAKYLIVKLDQFAGLSNMSWRRDLQ